MNRILIFLLAVSVHANLYSQQDSLIQPKKKKTQWSFSVSLQNYLSEGAKSSTTFFLAPRVGFFVYEGLQIEPEVVVLLSSADPAYMVNGNLVYNFATEGKTVPFLLAGYGIANSIPVHGVPIVYLNLSVGVLNLGVGIKAFVTENIALRGEYRFQKFTGKGKTESFYQYSYTQKVDARIHGFQFGIVIVP